ncbi:MAG: hypothetical protein ACI9D0_001194 [Bacteroidia bacterium]|jgi:hypothetical protein
MLLTLLLLAPNPLAPGLSPPLTALALVQEQQQDVGYVRAESVALERAVMQLAELGEWCQKNRAFLQRNRAFEAVLLWDSGHELARKTLGWKWEKSTSAWTQKRKPRVPKDQSKANADEAITKRAGILEPLRDSLIAAMDVDKTLSGERRQGVLDTLLEAMPNDATLRERSGYALASPDADADAEPVWILKASKRALEQRKILAKRRDELYSEDPAHKTAEPTESEQRLAMDWSAILSNGLVRALSTEGAEEAERALHACSVSIEYTREVFGHLLHPKYSIYLIDNDLQRSQFIRAWPSIDDARRELLLRMDGSTMGYDQLGAWGDTSDKRVDSAVRQALSLQMVQRFGLTGKSAWIHEGFGMYLTHDLIGTRLTYFSRVTNYVEGGEDNWDRDIKDPSADWLAMAREELEGPRPPNLAFTLGRDVNELKPRDLIVSYALASFFMEGHEPKLCQKLFTEIGNGKNPVATVEKLLGYGLPTLTKRLHTFLVETGS